ncbi:MAG: DUF2851 family protein [Flavobacteriaceae bacterium]|nr:DUF2851 family protein [Flavobacteriaceae bacterium]
MKEDFLHYVWKHSLFDFLNLKSTRGKQIELIDNGSHNTNEGPDFSNSKLRIDGQLWVGNVEIHIDSSDWYAHQHQYDENYDSVILHVVWQHDVDVFRQDNTQIDTLELKRLIPTGVLENYNGLFNKKTNKWINCEKQLKYVSMFSVDKMLKKTFLERLYAKENMINELLMKSQNNWEKVLFQLLAKSLGGNINGDLFVDIANSVDFSLIMKCSSNLLLLEALLLGQANLLDDDIENEYFKNIKKEYSFLRKTYNISPIVNGKLSFFRLRPPNFPTIRIAQLAQLYYRYNTLFSILISNKGIDKYYDILGVELSGFWGNHYTFDKKSNSSSKKISRNTIDILLINCIIPLKYVYEKHIGKTDVYTVLSEIRRIKHEKNSIVEKYLEIGFNIRNAMDSQAVIELNKNYCVVQKCLKCIVGKELLGRGGV